MFLVHMHPNLFIPLTSLPSMVEWRLLEMQLRKQKRSHYKSVTFIVVVTLSEVYVLYFFMRCIHCMFKSLTSPISVLKVILYYILHIFIGIDGTVPAPQCV